MHGKYEQTVDRESAYEMLEKRKAQQAADEASKAAEGGGGILDMLRGGLCFGTNTRGS